MCGIAGSIGLNPLDLKRAEAALESLARRGPDAHGKWKGVIGSSAVSLLHTRLAIVDLDARANQPFEWDGCVLVHNGEIYNFIELRDELIALGHSFKTKSDTEVIVHAYRQWGPECVDRFEGMWAFGLADLRRHVLFLSRDRFGEKPLFLWPQGDALYFASEVKALAAMKGQAPAVNLQQMRRYLVNGYKALFKRPETFFDGVDELAPGCNLLLQTHHSGKPERYWSLSYAPEEMSQSDAVEGSRARLFDSVRMRLRADVPVAFCLSGGVDSSALASIAAKHCGRQVHTFSIIDEDARYNEIENIEATVREISSDHHIIRTSTEGFLDRLADQIEYHDGPVSTISYYIHAFLSQAIAEAGFKVAISGSAADELFTGYYDHYNFWLAEMRESAEIDSLLSDWGESYGAYVRNPFLRDPLQFAKTPDERRHIYLNRELFNTLMHEPFEEDFFEAELSPNLLRRRMLNELFHEAIPVLLREDDLNSMSVSIENRSPYLDRQLAEFVYSVPSRHLIKDGYAKWILREAVGGVLNDQVRLDKQKRGFNASIDSLLDRKDSKVIDRLLEPGPIFEIVKRDRIEAFLREDFEDNSFSKFAFSFVSAKLFLESGLVSGQHARAVA